jgi:hypothetical protein
VRIGGAGDPAANLDLTLFDCASGACVIAGSSNNPGFTESVSASNPAAGRWIAVIDGMAVPEGRTTYTYTDQVDGRFGTVQVSDTPKNRPAGSSWTVPGTVTVTTPANGRQLQGTLSVVDSTGATVATSGVVIRSAS